MAIKSEQLENIFQEITQRFKNDRYVTVSPVAGKSSEQYEVTYNVTGVVQKEDKSIQETRSHTISITIPFGFPHFPPNCKPVSPTFHPDFDEAAICIGDFWSRDKSLSDVIIQIGRMISGEIHSKENAFNEEALAWYQENSAKLPFEIVNFSSQPSPTEESLDLEIEEEEDTSFEIDVLDDSDFDSDIDSDFNFMDIEETDFTDEAPADLPSQSLEPESLQTEDFRDLLKQKRFYELERVLHNTPKESSFDGRANIEKQITSSLAKAKKLQREADEYELKGKPANALALFEEVQSIVSDYPNIEQNIKRAQDSLELLGDWSPGGIDNFITDSPETKSTNGKSKTDDSNLTFFDVKSKSKLRILPLIISGSILALVAVFIYPLFTEKSQLKIAQQDFLDCQTLLEQKRYSSAESKCEAALKKAAGFQLFFHNKEKATLASNIKEVMESPKLKQGLAGNVMYQGEYIHKSVYDSILSYQNTKETGETFFKNKQWEEAILSYQAALKLTPYLKYSGPSELIRLKKQITLATVFQYMEEGFQYNEKQEWKNATSSFQKALDSAQSLAIEKRVAITEKITPQLSQTTFLQLIQQANSLFTTNEWDKALEHYEKAKSLTDKFKLSNPILLESLNEKIARTKLYASIKQGKEAFDKGKWDVAITKYATAINLLEQNKTLLSRGNSNDSRKKLSRVVLQASIIRDQQVVATLLKNEQFVEAISTLRGIQKTITKSEFKTDEEFIAIEKEAKTAIKDVQDQKLLADLTSHLKDNFQDFFTKNFSSTTSENLKDPIVTFVRKENKDFLFKLKCKEIGQGRPSILLMHYMYYSASKTWKFYDNAN